MSFIIATVALAACSSRARRAEHDYDALSQARAAPDLICKAASAAAEEWGKAGDKAKYAEWADKQHWACINADICRSNPAICPPADPDQAS